VDSTEPPVWPAGTLLHRLDPQARTALLGLGIEQKVPSGHVLLREGEKGLQVIVLRQALVKVTARMADGREALLAIRVSGDIVGEMAALNDSPRIATITTCRRSVVNMVHRDEFRSFLRSYPAAAIEVAGMVADRLRWAHQRRLDHASYTVKVRLARALVELALTYGHRTPREVILGVRLTQPELATLCGAAEVSLQRAFSDLRKAGMVATRQGWLTVRDLGRLRLVANLDDDGY
jgi:CRP/FNR family transcriptional regulator, cyclic AMP receptor protein